MTSHLHKDSDGAGILTKQNEQISSVKLNHLHLFDGSFQLSDLALYDVLIGQDEVDFFGDLFL